MRLVVRGFYWGEHLKNGARGTGPCGGGKCSPEIASSVWWQVGSDKRLSFHWAADGRPGRSILRVGHSRPVADAGKHYAVRQEPYGKV